MAKQSFKNTISFLIANGDCYTVESIQWNGCAEDLAQAIIEIASSDMIFMGVTFAFGKTCFHTAIELANAIIKMLQGKWEYEVAFEVDTSLTVSRLNKAKKVIREQI